MSVSEAAVSVVSEAAGIELRRDVDDLLRRVEALEGQPPPPQPPVPAGFWRSGVCRPGGPGQYTRASVEEFAAWRGRPCDLTLTYTRRNGTWQDLVGPGYVLGNWVGWGGTVLVAQPPAPDSFGPRVDGAKHRWVVENPGEARAQWARWGTSVAASGLDVVTIFDWEFNGNWYPHSAVDPGTFKAAWKIRVDAVRSTCPGARFGWTVNAGVSHYPPSKRAEDCWPGKDYADVVFVDLYAHWPKAVGWAATAAREENGAGRACYWRDFAVAQGAQLGLQEWGVVHAEGKEGSSDGDSADFIRWVHGFCSAGHAAGWFFGECYFNDTSRTNVWSDLMGARNPRAGAEYRRLWRPGV